MIRVCHKLLIDVLMKPAAQLIPFTQFPLHLGSGSDSESSKGSRSRSPSPEHGERSGNVRENQSR